MGCAETYSTGGPSKAQSLCPVKVQYDFIGLNICQFKSTNSGRECVEKTDLHCVHSTMRKIKISDVTRTMEAYVVRRSHEPLGAIRR